MEKFMLIFHGGQLPENQRTPENMQASMGKWFVWIDQLAKSGKYAAGEALLPGGKIVSGTSKTAVTDGPFIEGKEVVGGYFIVNANSYDEAVAICKDYPDYENGGRVHIRQVMKIDMPS
jgi:hypothetical protein